MRFAFSKNEIYRFLIVIWHRAHQPRAFKFPLSANSPVRKVYLSGKYSSNGIATISDASGSSPVAINIQLKSPSSLGAGVYTDTVQISGCYDQACTQPLANSPQEVQVQYTVTGSLAKLISLNPSTAVALGNAFTLTVNGSNFTQQSQVMWNSSSRVTTYVSATQLTAQITAADIAAVGSVPVSVIDPVNGTSNSLVFTIQAAPLSLSSISPTNVTVGGTGFMLTVGSGSGNLYALDGTTGQLAWQVTLPAPVVWQLALPLSGLAAGDGLLVVPAGTKVTAYVLSTNP